MAPKLLFTRETKTFITSIQKKNPLRAFLFILVFRSNIKMEKLDNKQHEDPEFFEVLTFFVNFEF
jgi:hypothetical protein